MSKREPPPGWGQPPAAGQVGPAGAPAAQWAPAPPSADARPTPATAASVLLIVEALLLVGLAAVAIVAALSLSLLSVADAPPNDLGSRLGRLAGLLVVVLGAYPAVVLVLGIRLRQPGRTIDWWLATGLQVLTVALFAAGAIAAGSPGHPTERPLDWPTRVLLGAGPALLPAAALTCLLTAATRRFHRVGRRLAG